MFLIAAGEDPMHECKRGEYGIGQDLRVAIEDAAAGAGHLMPSRSER